MGMSAGIKVVGRISVMPVDRRSSSLTDWGA
jgi:hypothetical protein